LLRWGGGSTRPGWVINLKDNHRDLLAEAGRLTAAGALQYHETTPQQDLQLGYVPEVDWPVATVSCTS